MNAICDLFIAKPAENLRRYCIALTRQFVKIGQDLRLRSRITCIIFHFLQSIITSSSKASAIRDGCSFKRLVTGRSCLIFGICLDTRLNVAANLWWHSFCSL